MRKLLYSFFLIFVGNMASAQVLAPTFLSETSTKNGIEVVLAAKDDVLPATKGIKVIVSGGGLTTPLEKFEPATAGGGNVTFKFSGLKPGTRYTVTATGTTCAVVSGACTYVSPEVRYITTVVDFPPRAVLQEEGNCPQFVGVNWTIPDTGGPVTNLVLKKSYNDGAEWHTVAHLAPHIRSYYDSGVMPGIHTTYMLHTVNAVGEITSSNNVKVQVRPYVAPDRAINFRSSLSHKTNSTIRVAWDNPEQDFGCRSNIRAAWYIMLKRGWDKEYKVYAAANPNATYYDITGLEQNEIVEIGIFPISDKDLMGHWASLKDKTFGVASKPSNVIGVAFQDKIGTSVIDVEWTHDGSDADYYIVEISTDGKNFRQMGIAKSGENHLKHVNLSEGLPYTYRVKAGNYIYGESDWAYMNGYVTYGYSAIPNAPYGLQAKWSGSNVMLTWVDDSNKEEKYVIERASIADGVFQEIGEVGRSINMYSDATMKGDTAYYRVKAENPLGLSGASKVAKIVKAATTSGTTPVGILAYPNPTIDRLNISIPGDLLGDNVAVKVYNSANSLVYTKNFTRSSDIDVDFKRFTPGIYNVVVETAGIKETKKIVKN